MDSSKIIERHFDESLRTLDAAAKTLNAPLERAAACMAECLRGGGKILSCGNGGSAADAQHFASELINRFELDRRALPSIALTTDSSTITSIANDNAYDKIFARQVGALGRPGDILLAISTSGNSGNVNEAIRHAHALDMRIVALSARDGGEMAGLLRDDDVEIRAPAESTARAQEIHLLSIHCICSLIDHAFAN